MPGVFLLEGILNLRIATLFFIENRFSCLAVNFAHDVCFFGGRQDSNAQRDQKFLSSAPNRRAPRRVKKALASASKRRLTVCSKEGIPLHNNHALSRRKQASAKREANRPRMGEGQVSEQDRRALSSPCDRRTINLIGEGTQKGHVTRSRAPVGGLRTIPSPPSLRGSGCAD
jgi:hypothetical protein